MTKNGDGSPNFEVKLAIDVPTKSELKTLIVELFSGDSDIALLYFFWPWDFECDWRLYRDS